MSLLELEGVGKRYGRGSSERVILRDVSLELNAGELVAVWGLRRSGRSTLLRVAAGVEPADEGVVRFAGRDLAARRGNGLGRAIGYCRKTFRTAEAQSVLEEVMVGLLARGTSPALAHARARSALERTGAEHCATLKPNGLDGAEAVRVAIAQALSHGPGLLVIDDPTVGVDLLARDGILLLLRSLADDGIAVLTTTAEASSLSGADRALSLGEGVLNGSPGPELASVMPLHAVAASSMSA
jgi:putative ABC transport system ATP-binding protein